MICRIDGGLGSGRRGFRRVRAARSASRPVPDRRDVAPRRAGRRTRRRDGRAGQPQQHRAQLPEGVRRPAARGDAAVDRARLEGRPRPVDVRLSDDDGGRLRYIIIL